MTSDFIVERLWPYTAGVNISEAGRWSLTKQMAKLPRNLDESNHTITYNCCHRYIAK